MDPKIFKAYDIRGIYPDQIDEQAIYKISKAFYKFLVNETGKQKLKIGIGRDMRLSSPSLVKNAIKGLVDSGADVIDFGLASTPVFYYGVGKYECDGGMQISASHNPKEYNGIKMVRKDSYPISLEDGLDIIRDLALKEKKEIEITNQNVSIIRKDITEEFIDYSLKFYNFTIKPLKIVADTANSMGAPDLELLFKKIPCELIKMNFELDGTFPNHEANPLVEENIEDLKKRVIEEKADLGIATDGDNDRIFFVDEKGNAIEPGIIRGIIAKEVLKHNPNSKICYDIRPGMITKDMIIENGGTPIITRVGHSLIKKQAIEEKSPFSGESSGHYFFQTDYGFFEMPIVVALILLNEVSKQKASELIKPLQKYHHSGEINFKVEDKDEKMKLLEQEFNDGKISWLDGISIEYEDFWFNVRPSNTESLLRLNLEARTKEIMNEILNKIKLIIEKK